MPNRLWPRANRWWTRSCRRPPNAPTQRRLAAAMSTPAPAGEPSFSVSGRVLHRRPFEVFRRALEAQSPASRRKRLRGGSSDCPSPTPRMGRTSSRRICRCFSRRAWPRRAIASDEKEHEARIWRSGGPGLGPVPAGAVSSSRLRRGGGPLYGAKLVRDALGSAAGKPRKGPAPRVVGGLDAATKAATAAAVLKAMSLNQGSRAGGAPASATAPRSPTNPIRAPITCGDLRGAHRRGLCTTSGDTSESTPETRAGLPAHGIDMAADTSLRCRASRHDDLTKIALYLRRARARVNTSLEADFATVRGWLGAAGRQARAERALRMAGANEDSLVSRAQKLGRDPPRMGAGGAAPPSSPRPGASRPDRTLRAGRSCTATTGGPTRGLARSN